MIPNKDNYSSYKYGGGPSSMMMSSGGIGSFRGGV